MVRILRVIAADFLDGTRVCAGRLLMPKALPPGAVLPVLVCSPVLGVLECAHSKAHFPRGAPPKKQSGAARAAPPKN